MARIKKRKQKKVLVTLDESVIIKLDALAADFVPEDKMTRSELINDIIDHCFTEKITDEIFPDVEWDILQKVMDFKDKLMKRSKKK